MSNEELFADTNARISDEWTGAPVEGKSGICDDTPDAPACR